MNIIRMILLSLVLASCASSPNYDRATTDIVFETETRPVVKVNPPYPDEALENELQGEVKMEFTIGEDGKARNIKVLQGIGEPLDSASIRTLQKALYHPKFAGVTTTAVAIYTLNKPL